MYLALPLIAAGRWGSVGCALRGDSAVPSSSCGPSRPQLGARGGNSLPGSHRRSDCSALRAQSISHLGAAFLQRQQPVLGVCVPSPMDFGGAQIPGVSQVGFSLHLCLPGVFHAGSGMPGDIWALPEPPQPITHGPQGAPGLEDGEGMGTGPPQLGQPAAQRGWGRREPAES